MKSEKPFFSIITSSWNREHYLKKLATSLMNQSLKNFEWIVGNDGSEDNTDEFIKSFSKKVDFKITYVNSQKRIGKSAMDNILLEHVSGEYLTWCDSDDILLPQTIKNISKLRSKSEEKEWIVPRGILCMILGCFAIYSALFSTGYFIYGELSNGFIFLISTIIFSFILFKISKKILSNE